MFSNNKFGHSRLRFLFIFVFSIKLQLQGTYKICRWLDSIRESLKEKTQILKDEGEFCWIRTADFWYRNQLFCRLSHNQCDQTARLSVQYLAIYGNKISPILAQKLSKSIKFLAKYWNLPFKNWLGVLKYCPFGEIWSNLVTLATTTALE